MTVTERDGVCSVCGGSTDGDCSCDDATVYGISPVETVTVLASDLGRVLHNACLFVSKDSLRPVLQSVRVVIDNGIITTTATDSYVLCEDSAQLVTARSDVPVSWSGIINGADLRPVIKALREKRTGDPEVSMTLRNNGLSITLPMLGSEGTTYALRLYTDDAFTVARGNAGSQYPNTSALWDSLGAEELPEGTIGVDPSRFAAFAKVVLRSGTTLARSSHGLRIAFHGQTRAMSISVPEDGSTLRALVMPTKV